MTESNVAQDQLKAFVRRIESVEDEINALNSDKSEIYREAKSSGFDVKQLRKVIQKRRLPADERQEADAIFDLYWDAIHGTPLADEKSLAHARVENIEEFPSEMPDPVAQIRANPAMAIVDASTLKNKSEPQPLTQAGSDLTTPQALNGQVATHSGIDKPISTATQESRRAETPEGTGQSAPSDKADDTGKPAGAKASAAPAPKYAAPGVVTWETYPPEGVTRSAVSIAFANIGQDAVVIKDDLANGKAQPIVKIGKEILDGWCRFMTARDMTEMDGKPLAYAVVQYDGTDPLIDAIKWNVEGRVLDEGQKRKIAATLARQNPNRKDDIYRAFELWMEPV